MYGRAVGDEQAMVVIFVAATLAPLLGGLVFGPRVPPVVIEIVIGILIGPKVLDLADQTTVVAFFSTLGLSFLFFMAGHGDRLREDPGHRP